MKYEIHYQDSNSYKGYSDIIIVAEKFSITDRTVTFYDKFDYIVAVFSLHNIIGWSKK